MANEHESTSRDAAAAPGRPALPRPRSPGIDLGEAVPRHWLGGNAVSTHVANGLNLLFPAGERFFVRSVNHYLDRIDDPLLRAQIQGFFGQEGRHAKEHERVLRLLEGQGYDVQRFLRLYVRIAYGVIEKLAPPALRLSTTAACEHFTAILAEDALGRRLLDEAHPAMRALFLWHAAEEIEHRAVAFDVLRRVSPSFALRMAGLAMATACLGGFWLLATATLLWQDRAVGRRRLFSEGRVARRHHDVKGVFVRGIRDYMRPNFHPLQRDIDHLAAEYLASVALS